MFYKFVKSRRLDEKAGERRLASNSYKRPSLFFFLLSHDDDDDDDDVNVDVDL